MKVLFFTHTLLSTLLLFLLSACDSGKGREIIIFEDAENGLSSKWTVVKGDTYPRQILAHNGSNYCVSLPVHWTDDGTVNPHEYHLKIDSAPKQFLEVDVGGTGQSVPHYMLGIQISTSYGMRTILWDSWYNHTNIKPTMKTYGSSVFMAFPSPIELVRGFGYESTTTWSHFQVDIEEALHYFEPDNAILWIETFIATGGDLDNIGIS